MAMVTVTPSDAHPLGIALSAEELKAMYLAGHTLYEAEQFERAAAIFRLLAMSEPLYTAAWQALGACHERLEDPVTAAKIYYTGFLLGGEAPEIGFACARARWLADDPAGAADMLESLEVCQLSPDLQRNVHALRNLMEKRS
jgi:Flp pilus assembly protein TadD